MQKCRCMHNRKMYFLKWFYSILRWGFLKWQLLLTSFQWRGLIKRFCDVNKTLKNDCTFYLSIFLQYKLQGALYLQPSSCRAKKGKRKNWSIWPIWPIDDPLCSQAPQKAQLRVFKKYHSMYRHLSIFGSRVDDRVNRNNVLSTEEIIITEHNTSVSTQFLGK